MPKTNERFEEYYDSLGLVEDAEKAEFWDALRKDLPNSFRFTGSRGQALPVQKLLKDRYIPEIISIEHDGKMVEPPNAISWYPDQLAWQMTTPKNIIRRFPPFASFQKFLVSETSVGNISRQEVVSMIPPLLIDIKPGMKVLDMCAAPGSKAMQLLEMVHGGEEAHIRKVIREVNEERGREVSPDGDFLKLELKEEEESSGGDWSDDGRATGLLIANDADYKRAHMLTHQMKRLNSPNIIVTNHDATMFPSIRLPSDPVPEGATPRGKYLKFDRILADVPCSGDGTCRKNANVWKDWTPGNALGLFSIQVRILIRSLQMLKVGGRVVYSTCSLNPVENEAVVASAIEHCGGHAKVSIVDCSSNLPKLKRKQGLLSWKVMDKQGRIWESWQEVEDEKTRSGEEGLARLTRGMFPPAGDIEKPALDRCMRVYPHLQDTGGFFITVLEKKSEIRASSQGDASKRPAVNQRKTHTSIINAVNEIQSQPSDGGNPVPKIESLDAIAPPEESLNFDGKVSAAARQNQENSLPSSTTPAKRALHDIADAEAATKRPKFREEVDDPAPEGEEDRLVHFPPPPGAVLDASRPELMDSPLNNDTPVPKASTSKDSLPTNGNPAANKQKSNQPFEEPFRYLSTDQPDLLSISSFYDLSPRFPRDRWMTRNATGVPSKTIYYTSELAKQILTANANTGIKFIHCGVKMFVKQDVQAADVCPWRIQSEGLSVVEGWIGEGRVVRLWRRSTLRSLLKEMFPKVHGGAWKELGEIGERVRDMGMGCCVLRVERKEDRRNDEHPEENDDDEGFSERMVLPLWRSLHSLNLMLPKEDRRAMLLRLFDDSEPLQDSSKDRFKVVGSAQENGDKAEDFEDGKDGVPMDEAREDDNVAAAGLEGHGLGDLEGMIKGG